MKVLKFGGSSLADWKRIKNVAGIVKKACSEDRIVVVLSAMKGVTDRLVESANMASMGDKSYRSNIEWISTKHVDTVRDLFKPTAQAGVITPIRIMLNELEDILHGVELIRECSLKTMDLIMSFGERMSCTIFSRYLEAVGVGASFVDARDCIKTNDNFGSAIVDFEKSYSLTRELVNRVIENGKIPIVTGFIASTEEGITTTLGRNGSDYTASIVGAGVGADCIEIWTDVDGVLSADPGLVEDAFVIDELSYEEAMELSYFGAKVIHPYTMIPAVERQIPIRIKNSLNPEVPGTLISGKIKKHKHPVTGIASINEIALLNVEGGGMIGIPGIAARIFSALARESINIMMISQASSEHSICLVFHEKDSKRALDSLRAELALEIEAKRIENLELRRDLVMIAIIGENMRGTPGISGKLFSALGSEGINVFAIAQGSSERNITFIISKNDEKKALLTIHKAFLK